MCWENEMSYAYLHNLGLSLILKLPKLTYASPGLIQYYAVHGYSEVSPIEFSGVYPEISL